MDTIRGQLKNPLVAAIGALILGLFFGLVILGWWVMAVAMEGCLAPTSARGFAKRLCAYDCRILCKE